MNLKERKKRNILTEELTEEQIKEKDDKWFVDAITPESMQKIEQGGDFLEAGPASTMYNDEETSKKIIEDVKASFERCAQIATLEHNPGLKLIFERIDAVCSSLHTDNENMMKERKTDTGLMQANIFAACQLRELKKWIEGKISTYKTEILDASQKEKIQ